MNTRAVMTLLAQRWKVITAFLVLGVVLAAAASAVVPKKYVAQATLYFTAVGAEDAASLAQGTLFVQNQIKSFPLLVTSPSVLMRVSDSLGGSPSAGDLAMRVSASVPTDSTVLQLSVQGDNPDIAAQSAKALATALAAEVTRLETRADPKVTPLRATLVDDPAPPTEPSSPSRPAFLAAGALLGLILGIGAALLQERRRGDPGKHA